MIAHTTEGVKMPTDSHVTSAKLSDSLFNICIRDGASLSIAIDIDRILI
jgi:hypothetical protein